MKAIARRPRVWEAQVPTDVPVLGNILDWPAKMQDVVYEAMERIEVSYGVKLELVQAIGLRDENGPYAKITVMEILTAKDVVIVQ